MWNSSVLLPREVPVEPDAAEAQRWAIEELEKSIYNTQPTLWQRFVNWFLDQISNLFSGTTSATSTVVVLVIIAAVIAAVVIVFLYRGRVRQNRPTAARAHRSATLFEDSRTSADLWADARSAAARDDFTSACLDAYRGIVRSLDERVLLDETPGMTAHEAAMAGTAIFPSLAAGWNAGGNVFDALAYGDRSGSRTDFDGLSTLAAAVERAEPVRRLAVAQ
ncbi:MAG: DUF4129 domain-containing protein [Ruaniaceae bacterium]|nr:DUF4129 domain-containing protein [Ruaniaceae bacterium]